MGMHSCASYLLHTHDVVDDVTRSQSRPNLKIAISLSAFIVRRGNNICGSRDIFLTHPSFGLKDRKMVKIETVSSDFHNFKYSITQLASPNLGHPLLPRSARQPVIMMITRDNHPYGVVDQGCNERPL